MASVTPALKLTAPNMMAVPTPFDTSAFPPAHYQIEIPGTIYYTDRHIKVRFPSKAVIKGIRIQGIYGKHPKTFTVKYKQMEYAEPDNWVSLGVS